MAAKKPKWERKAEERPGALLQAALEVFCKQGYRAARLESVAEAAGVSKGTIYRYFKNKEDLLKQALEERLRLKLEDAEQALQEHPGDAIAKLRFMVERHRKMSAQPDWGRFQRLMFGEIANEIPGLFRFWIEKVTFKGWKLLEGIIRAGQAEGVFRKDVNALAIAQFSLSGLFHQAFLEAHTGTRLRGAAPPAQISASAIDLLITGLRAGPASGRKHG
jgi:AcrR family transcriptional regulator